MPFFIIGFEHRYGQGSILGGKGGKLWLDPRTIMRRNRRHRDSSVEGNVQNSFKSTSWHFNHICVRTTDTIAYPQPLYTHDFI